MTRTIKGYYCLLCRVLVAPQYSFDCLACICAAFPTHSLKEGLSTCTVISGTSSQEAYLHFAAPIATAG